MRLLGAMNANVRLALSQHLENPEDLPRRLPFTYPIPEFSTIYSKDVCVFRGTEDDGYPFLK